MKYAIAQILLVAPTIACAGDWTQFRGRDGIGAADDARVPTKWSKTENLRWKAELPGRGLSGVVIAGGRAFVTACDGPNQTRLHVLCFDASSGKKLWQRSIWATGGTGCHPKTNMAAPTPAADGKAVYALFATADLVAYDHDGNLLWYRSLTGDYPTITNQVGMASSPILAGGVLAVPMDNSGESFLAGIDPKNGKNRWKVERPRDINWVTPAVRTSGDKTEIIFQGQHELVAYDAGSGQRRWGYVSDSKLAEMPSPIVGPMGEVLTIGGDLIALQPADEGQSPKVLWRANKLRGGGYPTPLFYQDRIYSASGNGVLTCGDAKDGKIIWQERLKGPIAGSPIAVNGHIYVLSEKGVMNVVKTGKEPKMVAQNTIEDDFLATPAVADGCIFIRSDKYLYCIGSK